jgi:histidyl-tRNA synthetase
MLKSCRGLDDLLPNETATWQQVESAARETAQALGYREIRTPLLEPTELFNTWRSPERELFKREPVHVKDRANKPVSLRPEVTTGVLRAYVEHRVYQSPPHFHKCSYLGPVAWFERRPHARYVQDVLFGIEVLGSPSPAVDADVIATAVAFLKTIGFKKYRLQISFRGCALCTPGYHEMLREFLADTMDKLCVECQAHQSSDPVYLLSCPERTCHEISRVMPTPYVALCPDCRRHFQSVQDDLDTQGIDFAVNPLLACDPGYYTRTIFSLWGPEEGAPLLASGGRYDSLLELLGGPATPAAGFSARLSACVQSAEANNLAVEESTVPDLVMASAGEESDRAVLKTINYLRQRNVRVERDYDNRTLKAQIRYASRLGARYLVVFGDDETRHNAIPVRDLTRNTQEFLPTSRLGEALYQYLRTKPRTRASATA